MEELMIRIENVSKQYKLGQIGGTTLRDELQRRSAKRRGKEDPTKMIGAKEGKPGETFLALDGVSFDVKKGERVGIIGHNGAGKSTLLKLISRVTAPTSGRIGLNGRVASMLEVGTGFHPELTGRENIYMNGAILGMNKKEIDAKMEDIIEFAECRQFIDTPVKRYSSGMYVKLAFSVAAHLDSEIMIMDEVLAVGDMAFQNKCLEKMSDVAKAERRTILYVSHNMNTIRQFCDRVIVLDHGKIIFDGDVEEGIENYIGIRNTSISKIDLLNLPRDKYFCDGCARFTRLEMDNEEALYSLNGKMLGRIYIQSSEDICNAVLEWMFITNGQTAGTVATKPIIHLMKDREINYRFEVDLSQFAPAKYYIKMVLSHRNKLGGIEYLDVLMDSYSFQIDEPFGFHDNIKWSIQYNGFNVGKEMKLFR